MTAPAHAGSGQTGTASSFRVLLDALTLSAPDTEAGPDARDWLTSDERACAWIERLEKEIAIRTETLRILRAPLPNRGAFRPVDLYAGIDHDHALRDEPADGAEDLLASARPPRSPGGSGVEPGEFEALRNERDELARMLERERAEYEELRLAYNRLAEVREAERSARGAVPPPGPEPPVSSALPLTPLEPVSGPEPTVEAERPSERELGADEEPLRPAPDPREADERIRELRRNLAENRRKRSGGRGLLRFLGLGGLR